MSRPKDERPGDREPIHKSDVARLEHALLLGSTSTDRGDLVALAGNIRHGAGALGCALHRLAAGGASPARTVISTPMSTVPRLTTSTTAARIPYANAAPFYALWGEAPFAVRDLVPRELGREAEGGTVDMGLMATGDFLRLRDRFEPLAPPMGVATRGAVQSVLLYSRRPPAALAGARVSVTPETSTSIRLLRLLLGVRRGLADVHYARGLDASQADALLVIGDRAMRMRDHRPAGFDHVLDLGADWLEWTGLPFVFAIWAVRSGLGAALKRELGAFLDASLTAGLATLPEIARAQTGTGWNAVETEEYLRRFRYRLGAEELAGLARFDALVTEHELTTLD